MFAQIQIQIPELTQKGSELILEMYQHKELTVKMGNACSKLLYAASPETFAKSCGLLLQRFASKDDQAAIYIAWLVLPFFPCLACLPANGPSIQHSAWLSFLPSPPLRGKRKKRGGGETRGERMVLHLMPSDCRTFYWTRRTWPAKQLKNSCKQSRTRL